jgi:outer membrane receptor protein involved in Fe transport
VQGSGTVRKFINSASDENSQGLELEYMTQINEQWQLRAHYTYFNSLPVSAFRQSDRLAALILNYQHHKWNFNLAANRAGERKMLTSGGAVRVDSYWLANAKIQYALSSATSLAVQAKNILDEDYLTPPQGNAFSSGLPNRGRELSVSFDWAL